MKCSPRLFLSSSDRSLRGQEEKDQSIENAILEEFPRARAACPASRIPNGKKLARGKFAIAKIGLAFAWNRKNRQKLG
ncbi:MAG: hypothetical protein F6J93_12870 [Oscillatoria sp. SIO1A7]|nr:hypothetical protein [Oscillatoria sp. SIO1A7]